jgi:hypothetical protein
MLAFFACDMMTASFSEHGPMKKKTTTPTPHDATFRQFLTQPDIARDFMELHLPAELQAICDLSTLNWNPARLLRMTSASISATFSIA